MAHFLLYGNVLDLSLPPSWEDRSIYTYVAPEQTLANLPTTAKAQGFRPNVVVTREHKGKHERAEAYAKEQLSASQKQLPQLKVQEEGPSNVGGLTTFTRVFTFVAPPQNVVVQQMQVFALVGDWIYTLTFSTLPVSFSEQKKVFDQILAKLQFNA